MRSPLTQLGLFTLLLSLIYPLQIPPIPPAISSTLTQVQRTSDRKNEADRLFQQGGEQYSNEQYRDALKTYQQVLEIRREIGDKAGMGETFQKIGASYDHLGEYSQALDFYQQALAIRAELGDKIGQGATLNGIGGIYYQQGEYNQALEIYQKALAIRREISDKAGEGRTLNNIALIYDQLGQYPKALEFYQQALEILKSIDNPRGESAILNNIGTIQLELGQYDRAIASFEQSLAIRRKIEDKTGEGTTLHNIGFVYNKLKQYPKALEFYQQSLTIRHAIADKAGEAATLNNIGFLYDEQGKHSIALQSLEQALAIFRDIGDKAGIGNTLDSIGTVYKSLSQYPKSLDLYQQALTIFREIGNKAGETVVLGNIGAVLEKQNQPELAIVFYKESVNVTEGIRKDLRVLSQEQQESYRKTVAETYRELADLLLKQNRVVEAQKVLDLLKVQELDDYLHNVPGNQQTSSGIELLNVEKQLLLNYQGIQEFNQFTSRPDVVALVQQLTQTTGNQNIKLAQIDDLQNQLRQLQQNAVLFYPLILEDRLELILVTPDSPPIHRTVPVKREQLEEAIASFREALTSPKYRTFDVRVKKTSLQLYDWLIKPIENDLAGAKTIIYAPDGQLRYIPLAAIFDGERWLIQRFRINNITAASFTDFNARSRDRPRILAGAWTKGSYNFKVGTREFAFSGLPFAGREVENLATTISSTTTLLDEAFNQQATISQMNDYNIVHFATHAAFVQGQPEDSFILFGDGSRATLRDIATWKMPNVDLVVLSACQTGVGGVLGNGQEILGFGYQMQQTGAKASIASLWSVDDQSTQILMNYFYRALQKSNTTKAEALQIAQMDLIADNIYTHPYFWASFILIGNGL